MDLKKFRHDYKLSQSELADVMGCKQANISSIENNTRQLTGLHIRLLIEKYGYDVISQYADADELPASVTINMPKIESNSGQVNGGGVNSMTTVDSNLIEALNLALKQNLNSQEHITKAQEQIDRLLSLLEKK